MDIRIEGQRKRLPTGTTSRKLAEKIHAKALTDIQEGKWFENEKGKTITFRELWAKYEVKYLKKRDLYTIKHLRPVFQDLVLSRITTDMIEDYILARAKEGASASTIYQEFALGRRMFNVARKKWKWVRHNPWADVEFSELQEIDNERHRWLTVEGEKVLLDNATPPYLADIIIFAIHTGCRRGEILSCDWRKNIDMTRRLITVQATKGGNRKVIPMSDTLYGMLLRRSKVRDISGRLFPYEMNAVKDAFERAVEKAKLQDLHFHDLRHTFATRLVQAGIDLYYAVKQMMGHRSIKTTERYAHHAPESLRPSVRVLDECYNRLGHNLDTIQGKETREKVALP
jgi:integrase